VKSKGMSSRKGKNGDCGTTEAAWAAGELGGGVVREICTASVFERRKEPRDAESRVKKRGPACWQDD